MIECVINVSEGRDRDLLDRLATTAGPDLLDVHSDPDHHRTVFTVVGVDAPRALAAAAVAAIDLTTHAGVHPRLGAVDVVPFVPLFDSTPADAVAARDDFARWAARELGVPCFLYGPLGEPAVADGGRHPAGWADWPDCRTLPTVRREAWHPLPPDAGPGTPHPTAGSMSVGARPVLVAYNLWLADADLAVAKEIARSLRGPAVRALGLEVAGHAQVSCNLVDPLTVSPAEVADAVSAQARVERAELVGLVPRAVLDRIDRRRWASLDLGEDRTIEDRLAAR
jgi:glutamate formiminotransferase